RKMLKDAEAAGGKLPDSPKVDLVLELKNTGDKDITVWVGGDATRLNLDLQGKGAISVTARRAFTSDFRMPKPGKLEAGKTTEIPIAGLSYGFRGAEKQAWWTEPGEYTLTATYSTALSPAPKDAKDAGEGFGKVTLTTAPVKLKVEGK